MNNKNAMYSAHAENRATKTAAEIAEEDAQEALYQKLYPSMYWVEAEEIRGLPPLKQGNANTPVSNSSCKSKK